MPRPQNSSKKEEEEEEEGLKKRIHSQEQVACSKPDGTSGLGKRKQEAHKEVVQFLK